MISTDGIGTRRWVVDPQSDTQASAENLPGTQFEFAGSSAALAGEGVSHLKAAAHAFGGSLAQTIRRYPYRSLVLAGGAGILAGILLKRPRARS